MFGALNGLYGLTLLLQAWGFLSWAMTLYPPVAFIILLGVPAIGVVLIAFLSLVVYFFLCQAFRVPVD